MVLINTSTAFCSFYSFLNVDIISIAQVELNETEINGNFSDPSYSEKDYNVDLVTQTEVSYVTEVAFTNATSVITTNDNSSSSSVNNSIRTSTASANFTTFAPTDHEQLNEASTNIGSTVTSDSGSELSCEDGWLNFGNFCYWVSTFEIQISNCFGKVIFTKRYRDHFILTRFLYRILIQHVGFTLISILLPYINPCSPEGFSQT